jgi:Domain of unknown function (DUF4136)
MKTFAVTVVLSLMSVLVSIAIAAATTTYTPKYKIKVVADKRTDFSKFRTYTWQESHPSAVKEIDEEMVAAVERQLAAVGLTKVPDGQGDVLATYASLTRTDVNVRAKPLSKDYRPEYPVATLVVSLLDPATLRPLLEMRADRRVEPAGLRATINNAVEEMFRQYPTRRD